MRNGRDGIDGIDGLRGSYWYSGTGITGTSTTSTIFTGSGAISALPGDMYLNTSTQNVYKCVNPGSASTARWSYLCNIKGATGESTNITSVYASTEFKDFDNSSANFDDNNISVEVSSGGTNSDRSFLFSFKYPVLHGDIDTLTDDATGLVYWDPTYCRRAYHMFTAEHADEYTIFLPNIIMDLDTAKAFLGIQQYLIFQNRVDYDLSIMFMSNPSTSDQDVLVANAPARIISIPKDSVFEFSAILLPKDGNVASTQNLAYYITWTDYGANRTFVGTPD